MFGPFYRAPGESRDGIEGFGLGLAIVAPIMGAPGGKALLRSQEGKGSCFPLRFPNSESSRLQRSGYRRRFAASAVFKQVFARGRLRGSFGPGRLLSLALQENVDVIFYLRGPGEFFSP
ncbi:MAG: ATP-binding protein [Thermoanaerobaculaceae bacterium]